MTRTFYFKTVSDAHREVYETAKAANETAISKIRPGVPLCQLDAPLKAGDLISTTALDILSVFLNMNSEMFPLPIHGRQNQA